MKNKRFFITCLVLLSIFIITFSVIVNANNSQKSQKVLTEKRYSSYKSSYMYEDITDTSKFDKKLLFQKINEYKQLIDSNNTTKKLSIDIIDSKEQNNIKFSNNEINSRIESTLNLDNEVFCLNAMTGDLIRYIRKTETLAPLSSKIILSEDEIKQIGLEMFEKIKGNKYNDYVFESFDQYDEDMWTIRFYKYYDGLINYGEAVKISYSPQRHEILSLIILDTPYENNSVEISEEEAYNIAKKYMQKTTATDMSVEINIVSPNYFWYKNSSQYKNINYRKCRNRFKK